jgi:flagella basal body P-ring formation protein FlgA
MKKLIGLLYLSLLLLTNITLAEQLLDVDKSLIILLRQQGAIAFAGSEVILNYDKKLIPQHKILDIALEHVDNKNQKFSVIVDYEHFNIKSQKRITGYYDEYVFVAICNKALKRNDIIEEHDLATQKFNAKLISKSALIHKKQLLHKTPRHVIKAYEIVNASQLMDPIIIHKLQIVNLTYINRHVSIKIPVQAMENGSFGSAIKVKNLKSNTILHAVVEDGGNVKIVRHAL